MDDSMGCMRGGGREGRKRDGGVTRRDVVMKEKMGNWGLMFPNSN